MNHYVHLTITEDFLAQSFSNETITGSGPLMTNSFSFNQTYSDVRFSPIDDRLTNDYRNNPENFSTLSTLECLRAYSQPFAWRPNLFAIAANNNVSSLLPGSPNCSVIPCEVEANNKNASLLAWGTYGPKDTNGGGLCERAPGMDVGECSRLFDWSEEDTKTWTMGFLYGFKIDHFLVNRHVVTESEISQQLCHLQCSPVILLRTYRHRPIVNTRNN
jgi:hypothetical protein